MTAHAPAAEAARYLMRPAQATDLDALERFAAASAHGITTLPADRPALQDRLARSAHAFSSPDDASGEEIYLFVLEDTASGRVVGTSGISASAGFGSQFHAYRNEVVVHASKALGTSNRMHTLHLCNDLSGASLLTSFYIEPAYERTLAPQLLSRARLLFIAEFPERFAERVAAESPGLADDAGHCPFWSAVGQRFFGMDYPAAERLAGGRHKSFIAELMPHAPIYVALLPKAAQWAIGQLHPVAELPFSILQDEGFDADTYVDIFDAGPIVEARLDTLHTVAHARRARCGAGSAEPGPQADARPMHIACKPAREGFRAVLTPAGSGPQSLPSAAAQRLGLGPQEAAALSPLSAAALARGAAHV